MTEISLSREGSLLTKLIADLNLSYIRGAYTSILVRSLATDSRHVRAGDLFIALKGQHCDGRDFIAQAIAAGACAVLLDEALLPDTELNRLQEETSVPFLYSSDPRRKVALLAARFFAPLPKNLLAVTGTAGKSSVVGFARQLCAGAGFPAASLGTIGVDITLPSGQTPSEEEENFLYPLREGKTLTTPDPVSLHAHLSQLANRGITHVALEASSHGLDQRRLDGLPLTAGAFTNFGRDHLDYHHDLESYFAAKKRLVTLLAESGGTLVLDPTQVGAEAMQRCAEERGVYCLQTGPCGSEIRLLHHHPVAGGTALQVEVEGKHFEGVLPLLGIFQVSNALNAFGLALCAGGSPDALFEALTRLKGVPGRLDFLGCTQEGAQIFVDYAHKPEALQHVLNALRSLTKGRLFVVFGAGGMRDIGKRPLMGQIAQTLADIVVVTDDNPRDEDPAAIRAAVRAGAPEALEIGDRAQAIITAFQMLKAGDVLCVAGKGHEMTQEIAGKTFPFSDHIVLRTLLDQETKKRKD